MAKEIVVESKGKKYVYKHCTDAYLGITSDHVMKASSIHPYRFIAFWPTEGKNESFDGAGNGLLSDMECENFYRLVGVK